MRLLGELEARRSALGRDSIRLIITVRLWTREGRGVGGVTRPDRLLAVVAVLLVAVFAASDIVVFIYRCCSLVALMKALDACFPQGWTRSSEGQAIKAPAAQGDWTQNKHSVGTQPS